MKLDASMGSGSMTGREMLDLTVEKFAKQALRTILMTYRDFEENEYQRLQK
jgi:hypothetical protein